MRNPARRVSLAVVLVLVVLVAGDFGARVVEENRLEARINARKGLDGAVIRFESWPFTWHSRGEYFPRTTLILTLKKDGVDYEPLILHLRDLSYAENAQCPGNTSLAVGAVSGDGTAFIQESDVAQVLRRDYGFDDVAIAPGAIELTRANGANDTIEPSQAFIRPTDISGNIVFQDEEPIVIHLEEPVDGVK